MVKEDEILIIKIVLDHEGKIPFELWNVVCSPPRFQYTLNKWVDKGFWEYGVSLRSGWATHLGMYTFQTILEGSNNER